MPGTLPPAPAQKSAVPGGIWCPVVSLYKDTPRQEIDLEASYTYFSHLIRGGVNGLVLQGSTAEAALLSREERIDITRTARNAATDLGVPDFPHAAGVSGQSTNETLRLVDDAAAAGADFGLLLSPSYWPKAITNDALINFYREIADHSPVPIIAYNIATHLNIVGTKLTCANAGKVTSLTARLSPSEFSVFAGQSDWLLPCLIGGGIGCVTGIGNVFPKSVSRLYSLWQEGKIDEARKLQGQVALAEAACKKGLAATKYGTAYFAGPISGLKDYALFHPRKPYKPASKALQESTISTMQSLAELEKSLPDTISYPSKRGTIANGINGPPNSSLRVRFTLNTGAEIPAVGFGTWKAAPGDVAKAVEAAFAAGYQHSDCAPLYGNEAEIGLVFKQAPVPRACDHQCVQSALDKSMSDLGLDYVDLYLIHWPVTLSPETGAEYGKEDRKVHMTGWDFRETWREMEKLLHTGKVKAIGVANFSTVNLEKLLAVAEVIPAVNQTELQPLLPQDKLHADCSSKGIHQTAFGPLGGTGSTLHEDAVIVEIAKKRGVATGNVMLSWGIAKGWSVIPKSVNPDRIAANLHNNFVPTDEEMKQIDALASKQGKRFDRPDWGTTVFHDDEEANVV